MTVARASALSGGHSGASRCSWLQRLGRVHGTRMFGRLIVPVSGGVRWRTQGSCLNDTPCCFLGEGVQRDVLNESACDKEWWDM